MSNYIFEENNLPKIGPQNKYVMHFGKAFIEYIKLQDEYENFIDIYDELYPNKKYNGEFIKMDLKKFKKISSKIPNFTIREIKFLKTKYKTLIHSDEYRKNKFKEISRKYFFENPDYVKNKITKLMNRYYKKKYSDNIYSNENDKE